MANYTLGRYRKNLPSETFTKFIKIYSQFVIKVCTNLSSNYSGERALLQNIRKIADDVFIVNTAILPRTGTQPTIKVDYLVYKINNDTKYPYRIADIITEDISILNSQRAEFASIIANDGIEALINKLSNNF